jgi:TolQ protein
MMLREFGRSVQGALRLAAAAALLLTGVVVAPPAADAASQPRAVLLAQAPESKAPETQAPAGPDAAPAPASSQPAIGGTMVGPNADQFGVVAMFLHADIVVKFVMIFLALSSVVTWSILIEKSLALAKVNRLSRRFLAVFRTGKAIEDVEARIGKTGTGPMAEMWAAAMDEWDLFHQGLRGTATNHQTDRLLQRMVLTAGLVQERELVRLSGSMGILATIGSTSPFIGLFGTVWGILDSFIGIAASRASTLAVVAPGIAEALLATAIGLFAAIPAVMIYNKFAREITRITGSLDNFAAELTTVASRELENRTAAMRA